MAPPNLEHAVLHARDCIERLKRGMGEVRKLELRVDDSRGRGERLGGIAVTTRDHSIARFERRAVVLEQLLAAAGLGRAFVPIDAERAPALDRGPSIGRHHGNPARDLDHLDHALDRPRSGGIERLDLAAKARRMGDCRDQHVWQHHVDREIFPAGALGRGIEPAQGGVADQLPAAWLLEFDRSRHRLLRGLGGERAEA